MTFRTSCRYWGLLAGLRILLVLSYIVIWLLVRRRDSKRAEDYQLESVKNGKMKYWFGHLAQLFIFSLLVTMSNCLFRRCIYVPIFFHSNALVVMCHTPGYLICAKVKGILYGLWFIFGLVMANIAQPKLKKAYINKQSRPLINNEGLWRSESHSDPW